MKFKSVVTTLLVVLALTLISAPAYAQRVIVTPEASSSAKLTPVMTTTGTAGSATAVNISTVATQTYGIVVDAGGNTSGTVVYVNFFDAATANVTPGTTVAKFSIGIATGTGSIGLTRVQDPGVSMGLPWSTALSVNCTTTRADIASSGATGTTVPCHVITWRK